MTSVTCRPTVRDRAGRLAEAAALAGGAISLSVLVIVVAQADRDAPRHSAFRDPLSWFASDEAPTPDRVRTLLTAIGLAMIGLAAAGIVRRRPTPVVAAVALAGALVIGLARWSIDCSLRFAYCEGRVAAGVVGDAHLVHVALSAALVVVVVAMLIGGLRRHRGPASAVAAVVGTGAATVILLAPANAWVGTLQLILFAAGGWTAVHLWRATA